MVILNSCSKKIENTSAPTNITGKWSVVQVNANDHWGGALYWQNVKVATKVWFSEDGKYWRKSAPDSSYTLIGTYTSVSDSTIEITEAAPVNPSAPSYTLQYFIDPEGFLILQFNQFEGIAAEKLTHEN
jgi:hypothetical protein